MSNPNLPMPPEGAKLVPCEPTEEMMLAGVQATVRDAPRWEDRDIAATWQVAEAYRAMLAASPTIPVQTAGAVADLDARMKAAGMIPLTDLLNGDTPMKRWMAHAGVRDIASFKDWLDRKHREFMTMRRGYEPKDELYEWVFAHAAAFGEAAVNLRQALSAPTPPAAEGDAGAESIQRWTANVGWDRCTRAPVPEFDMDENGGWVDYEDHASALASRDADLARLVEETGSTSVDDMRDMALVGHSLMRQIEHIRETPGPFHDWTPAEDPAEIVIDLENAFHEAEAALARVTRERDEARHDLASLVEETGCSSVGDVLDMALVGHSLLAAIDEVRKTNGLFKNWMPTVSPAEIVVDLENARHEAEAALATARTTSEQAADVPLTLSVLRAAWTLLDNTTDGGDTEAQEVQPEDWQALSDAMDALEQGDPEAYREIHPETALRAATTGQEAGRG